MRLARLETVGITAMIAMLAVAAPAAGSLEAEEHCLLRTTQVEPKVLTVAEELCAPEFSVILKELRAPDDMVRRVRHPSQLTADDMSSLGPGRSAVIPGAKGATAFVIGIHHDGFGGTGSSFSVTGNDCAGGSLNLGTDWNNRISSTTNGCPAIDHFDGFNLFGAVQTTYGAGADLGTMNNRASSIRYR